MSRELRYQRLIHAWPARAFDLVQEPGGQREFYGNDAPGWVVDSRCELRVGGAWEIAFGASPGELYRHLHVFEAIKRPRRLLLVTTETRLDGSRLAFRTEFTFAPRDGATLMTMVQWGFPSDELRDEHGRGLPHAFDRLERALRPEEGARAAAADLDLDPAQGLLAALAPAFEPFFAAAEEELIDLDLIAEQRAFGRDHGAAQLLEHRPCGLVSREAELALQLLGRDAGMKRRDEVGRPEPWAQRQPGLVHHGARGDRRLPAARRADPQVTAGLLAYLAGIAGRADEALRRPRREQVRTTVLLATEPPLELQNRQREAGTDHPAKLRHSPDGAKRVRTLALSRDGVATLGPRSRQQFQRPAPTSRSLGEVATGAVVVGRKQDVRLRRSLAVQQRTHALASAAQGVNRTVRQSLPAWQWYPFNWRVRRARVR